MFASDAAGRVLTWWPDEPHLDGTDSLVGAIVGELAALLGAPVGVTPTGPYVAAQISDPLAVLAVAARLGIELTVLGDLPPGIGDVPDGAVA